MLNKYEINVRAHEGLLPWQHQHHHHLPCHPRARPAHSPHSCGSGERASQARHSDGTEMGGERQMTVTGVCF